MLNKTNWLEGEDFLAKSNRIFVDLINKYGSCDLSPIEPDRYYITLIKGIISQQVASDVSQSLFDIFVSKYSISPDPTIIANVQVQDLLQCGLPRQKIDYIKDLSQAIAEKKIVLEDFDSLEDNVIIKQLTQIKGFGRWTAEIFLILALNRPDVLPADDFGLKKAIKDVFNLPKVPQKRSEITQIAAAWQPWRSLAVWYLWQYFADNG